jgi:predicted RNase H-like HicB family nuclease
MRIYTVVLEYDPEAPGYSVRVPALVGCYSQGQTVEEALVNVREAIAGHILAMEQIGVPVPLEDRKTVPSDAVAAVAGSSGNTRVLVSRVAA